MCILAADCPVTSRSKTCLGSNVWKRAGLIIKFPELHGDPRAYRVQGLQED